MNIFFFFGKHLFFSFSFFSFFFFAIENFTFQQQTIRDLKTTSKELGKPFLYTWQHWSKRLLGWLIGQMRKTKSIWSLRTCYRHIILGYLLSSPISSFGELCKIGTRIEDAINTRQLDKGYEKPSIKKIYGRAYLTPKHPTLWVWAPQQSTNYQSYTKKARQKFSRLGMSLAQAYENLTSKDTSSL